MEVERVSYRNRLNDAQIRLASYRPRLGEDFAFTVELALKKAELDDIERDLAGSDEQEEEAGPAAA